MILDSLTSQTAKREFDQEEGENVDKKIMSASLRQIHLGLCKYSRAATIQARLVRDKLDLKHRSIVDRSVTVLTAEFLPVYTSGRREDTYAAEKVLDLTRNGNIEYHAAERGGQLTFHGPGQLVAYPILDLNAFALGARKWINLLENTVIQVCREYNVSTRSRPDTGVWTSDNDKIASIGVHLRRNITSHGMALNVSTDLAYFDRIVACGLPSARATSLEEHGIHIPTEAVARVFVQKLAYNLDIKDYAFA